MLTVRRTSRQAQSEVFRAVRSFSRRDACCQQHRSAISLCIVKALLARSATAQCYSNAHEQSLYEVEMTRTPLANQ